MIALMMLLCLALTGCGQNTDKNTENLGNDASLPSYDTDADRPGAGSFADEAEAALGNNNGSNADENRLPGDSSEDANSSNNALTNADGTYTWQVGNYELTTHINVMDYIDGNVWRVNDMAAALGWDKNSRASSKKPMTFQMDDTYDQYINFSDSSDHCGAIMIYINGDRTPHSLVLPARASDDYTFNDKDFTMSFEGIVAFAYACEQISANPTVDPFDGVLGTQGGGYVY